jgi:hypothetical protein
MSKFPLMMAFLNPAKGPPLMDVVLIVVIPEIVLVEPSSVILPVPTVRIPVILASPRTCNL